MQMGNIIAGAIAVTISGMVLMLFATTCIVVVESNKNESILK